MKISVNGRIETMNELKHLMESAENGEITGLVYVAFMYNRNYFTGISGVARNEPELAFGTLALLSDDLKERVRNKI
jgi:hypothetical protein